ncbi:MAG: hypothetical protein IJT54_05610, partial [Candidatus Methanomethylophilaceae archaeon]|nr:hypothetical protein [Candidatus Methanomethylophilaceae archaeon]
MAEKEGFWQLVRKGYQSMKEDFNPPKEETPKEVTEEISTTEVEQVQTVDDVQPDTGTEVSDESMQGATFVKREFVSDEEIIEE